MRKKLKLSPWFDIKVKPVHIGVYEFNPSSLNDQWFRKWDGNSWCWGSDDIREASLSFEKIKVKGEQWRGILK